MLQNNNIDNEFISKIIKEQPLGDAFSVKKTEEDKTDDIQKVRYQGGEEVKDSNGETITEEKRSIIPPFKKEVPLKRKYSEPENSQELSQDIHKYMDMGLSFNDAWDWELKQYPGTAKNINEFYKARDNSKIDNDKEYQYTNDVINYDEKGNAYKNKLTPKESVEVESLNKLGIDSLLRGDDYYNTTFRLPDEERSLPATKLYQYLVKNKKLDEWQDLMTNPSYGSFIDLKNSLIDEIKNYKDFRAQEKDDIINLLNETDNGYTKWLTALNKQAEKAKQEEEAKKAKAAKTPKPETLGSFTTADGKTTDVKYPPVATLTDKNGNEIVIDSKQYQENREKDAEAKAAAEKEAIKQEQPEANAETKAEETSPAIEDGKSINDDNKKYLASLQEKDAEELEAERETAAERAKRISDQLEEAEAYDEWLKNPTILSGIFNKGMPWYKKIGLGTSALSAIASDVLANYARGLNGSTDFSNKAVAELNKYVDAVNTERAKAIGKKAAKPYETDAENEEKLNQAVAKLKRTSAGIYIDESPLRYLVQNAQLGKELIKDEKELAIFLNEAEKGFIDSIGKNKKEKARYVNEDNTLTPEGRVVFLDEMETAINDFGRVLDLDETKIANGLKLLETEKKRAEIIKDIAGARLENTTQFMNAEADIKQRISEASTLKTKLSEVQDREQALKLAQEAKSAFSDLNRKTSIDSLTKEERNELFNSEEFSEVKRNLDEELKKHGYALKAGAQLGSEWTVAKISANADWTDEQANTAVREATTNFLNKNSENNVKSNNVNNSINKMIDDAINDVYRLYNDSSVEDFKEKREEALNRIDELIRTLEGYSTEVQRIKNDYLNKNPVEKTNYENVLNKYNKVEEQPNNNNEMLNAFNTYRVPTNNINWYKHKLGLA